MAPHVTPDMVADALIAEIRTAIDTAVGGVVATPSPGAASGDGWRFSGSVGGGRRGSFSAWIDLGGAEALTRRLTGVEAPDRAVVTACLRDLWSQAGASLGGRTGFTGVTVSFGTAEAGGAPDHAVVYELRAGSLTLRVAVAVELADATADGRAVPRGNLDVVLDIDLPLVVRFARTVMSIKALSTLGPGSIVDMERSPDEPVQILVGDHVIASGEVVVVGGHYGVRITDLTSAAERMRGLEV